MEPLIFIDTHVAVWLYYGAKEEFSGKAREAIDLNELLISPMVGLELNYLKEVGKIDDGMDRILPVLTSQFGATVLEGSFLNIIQEASTFTWTRDPFDRIITAHALLECKRLLTKDKTIKKNYEMAFW